MRVLIVDDSLVVRTAIRAALQGDARIEVVGTASNGHIALEMLEQKQVDLVILDLEMPVLDGIHTLRALRKSGSLTKVIVFSSLTSRGSEMTLEALTHGAQDFLAKPKCENPERAAAQFRAELLPKVLQFLPPASALPTRHPDSPPSRKEISTFRPRAIVIASSTGGPAALEKLFSELHGTLRVPIFITQHMPPVFTATFAKRLGEISGLPCKEASQGDVVKPGIYVAPGDYHLTLKAEGAGQKIQLDKGPQQNSVRPAADPMFVSAAAIWTSSLLALVLTGMGEDGLSGCRSVKQAGGGVVIQDQASCVVFGMPGAVALHSLQDETYDLARLQGLLKKAALV